MKKILFSLLALLSLNIEAKSLAGSAVDLLKWQGTLPTRESKIEDKLHAFMQKSEMKLKQKWSKGVTAITCNRFCGRPLMAQACIRMYDGNIAQIRMDHPKCLQRMAKNSAKICASFRKKFKMLNADQKTYESLCTQLLAEGTAQYTARFFGV